MTVALLWSRQVRFLETESTNFRDKATSLASANTRIVNEGRRDKLLVHDIEVKRMVAESEWKIHRGSLAVQTAKSMVR